ncbi:DUF6716 putative glycosyltransferase [Microbacterium sp. gxy059]|uniref:DUF6716 putative glycosyltransferase n=1 Tax=Microbacterium sp. gxy059 TaxID=2957199 RepID=UPI003D998DAF
MTEQACSLRIVAVADTDSYVKWAAALLGASHADARLVVLDTELAVSDAQLAAALHGTGLGVDRVERRSLDELPDAIRGADAVLAAARGPVARVVARTAGRQDPRPVIATGLPGISLPATWLALHFRRECDLFVLHSRREIEAFEALARERGIDQRFALATLPFARRAAHGRAAARGTDLVFAAQAIVPREREDRLRLAGILVDAARADPSRRVVLKLRGRPGEHQTHREDDALPDLVDEIGGAPDNLVVSYAPMAEALATAEGLVTVSSTAAIEAAARGVPVIALDAFGVSPELINVVFEGSGLLAGADDVAARRFRLPHAAWLADNYFHDPRDDSWEYTLTALVHRRRAGELPPRPEPRAPGGRAREAWERRVALGARDETAAGRAAYAIGLPIRAVLRTWRRIRTRARLAGARDAVR